jgi:hypothetical protein
VLPPHPARDKRLTIPKTTSILVSTGLLFMAGTLQVPIVPMSARVPVAASMLYIETLLEPEFVT